MIRRSGLRRRRSVPLFRARAVKPRPLPRDYLPCTFQQALGVVDLNEKRGCEPLALGMSPLLPTGLGGVVAGRACARLSSRKRGLRRHVTGLRPDLILGIIYDARAPVACLAALAVNTTPALSVRPAFAGLVDVGPARPSGARTSMRGGAARYREVGDAGPAANDAVRTDSVEGHAPTCARRACHVPRLGVRRWQTAS